MDSGITDASLHAARQLESSVPQLNSDIMGSNIDQALARSSTRPTAWMDGLRGWAAVSVIGCHYFVFFLDGLYYGYGAKVGDDVETSPFSTPLIRFIFDGRNDVSFFFIISGYVISLGALQAMSSGDSNAALERLTTSTFRRFFRLYLPIYILNLLCAFGAYLGAYELMGSYMTPTGRKTHFPGSYREEHLKKRSSLLAQLQVWVACMIQITNPFKLGSIYVEHDGHLWTIPIEFRQSLHLYVALLGLARCTPVARMVMLFVIGWCSYYAGVWAAPLFFCGAALAQFDIIRATRDPNHVKLAAPISLTEQQQHNRSDFFSFSARSIQLLRTVCWIIAIGLMSYPLENLKHPAPGYHWMNKLIPSSIPYPANFWKGPACVVVVLLLTTSEHQMSSAHPGWFHRLLTHPSSQLMGKLMFGLYVVHFHVLHTFGLLVPHAIWFFIGKGNALNYTVGLWLGFVINIGSCLVAARLFHIYIEQPAINLTKSIENFLFTPS